MKSKSTYVLFGCWADPDRKYHESGYVAFSNKDRDFEVYLTEDIDLAKRYDGSIEDGKGSPKDWAKMLNEDYGLNVHPVKMNIR